jgi:hypothetical protein
MILQLKDVIKRFYTDDNRHEISSTYDIIFRAKNLYRQGISLRSRDQRASDPRRTALARASSIYKRQIRPLVREGAPTKTEP